PPPAEGPGNTLSTLAALYGRDFVDPEKMIETLFETYSEDQLKQEIGWYGAYSALAYRVLAQKYFTANKDRIRHDLVTRFQDLKQAFIEDIQTDIQTDIQRTRSLTAEQVTDLKRRIAERYFAQKDAEALVQSDRDR